MAVSIKGEKTIEAGTPVALFDTPLTFQRGQLPRTHRYDVAPDGRFLLAVPKATAAAPPIVAVMNWTAGLEKQTLSNKDLTPSRGFTSTSKNSHA